MKVQNMAYAGAFEAMKECKWLTKAEDTNLLQHTGSGKGLLPAFSILLTHPLQCILTPLNLHTQRFQITMRARV